MTRERRGGEVLSCFRAGDDYADDAANKLSIDRMADVTHARKLGISAAWAAFFSMNRATI